MKINTFIALGLGTILIVAPITAKPYAEETPIVTLTPIPKPTVTPTPTPTPKLLSKQNVISAINKHLDGKLKNKGEEFYFAGTLYNVNPMLLAAICKQESANGKSNAINKKNNPSGFMADSDLGILRTFDDVDHGIVETARLLKEHYIDKGFKDINSIGNKYCPVGARNDPNDLNKHWIPNVTDFYIKILTDAERGV